MFEYFWRESGQKDFGLINKKLFISPQYIPLFSSCSSLFVEKYIKHKGFV